jgi:hypothetical protein
MPEEQIAMADQVKVLSMNNQQLGEIVQQIGKLFLSFDARMSLLENLLSQRMTVSSMQAKSICSAVQAQARALCKRYGLPYVKFGKAFRRALWRDFKKQHNIADVHDLPAAYYDIAVTFVHSWNSFTLACRLSDKYDT